MSLQMLPKKRTTNFREDETKLLIQLWGSPAVQNKLYLTHRKAPVMRLIAATLQKHGFYRTPDEIKTRIRNLKCLYHRIKKSLHTGHGIGTVDPDWPHYKAMDEILSKKNSAHRDLVYKENLLSEVSELTSMPVKAELALDDDSHNDDLESNSSNDNGTDDEFDECSSPKPLIIEEDFCPKGPIKIAPKPNPPALQTILKPAPTPVFPNLHIQTTPTLTSQQTQIQNQIQNQIANQIKVQMAQSQPQSNVVNSTTTAVSHGAQHMPFPLLILNNTQNSQNLGTKTVTVSSQGAMAGLNNNTNGNNESNRLLRELLQVQKENLELEKQRLAVEKQKLQYDKLLGSQLLGLVPMMTKILEKFDTHKKELEKETTIEPQLPLLRTIKRSPSTEELFNVDTSEFQEGPILKKVLELGKKRLKLMNEVESASDSGISDDCVIIERCLD